MGELSSPAAFRPSSSYLSREMIYRAVWRWHFYAGLLTLPFLVLLAVTGGLYLFHNEIDGWVYRDRLRVEARPAPTLAPQRLVERALAAVPGQALTYVTPKDDGAAAEVEVRTPAGDKLSVYLDPYDGRVLGTLGYRQSVMWIVRRLHSLALFGDWPPYIIEVVGGWTIILVATGLYLWWPRSGQRGGAVTLRGTPRRRVFWRDLHAVTGLIAGLFIAFLAVTGMPWSSFWGSRAQTIISASGQGFPRGAWGDKPVSSVPMQDAVGEVGWTMQTAPMPLSHHHPEQAASSQPRTNLPPPIGLDRAVAIFDRLGLTPGYAVALPQTPDGVYSGTIYPADLAKERAIHLDQYTGQTLIDVSFADYGLGGKAIEWGVNVHMGQEFGRLNQIVLALVCLLIVVMAVAALVMWWKRRPRGRLAAPPWPHDRRVIIGVTLLIGLLGMLYPLTGLSMLVILAFDLIWQRSEAAAA